MPAFPFVVPLFGILSKLDNAFASLLRNCAPMNNIQQDIPKVSQTEKVRIKSLIEDTRVSVVNAATGSGYTEEMQAVDLSSEDDSDMHTDENESSSSVAIANTDAEGANLGRVYEKTLAILGDDLS